MTKYFLFLLCATTLTLQGQTLLKGQISNPDEDKASITIINLTYRKAAITNAQGYFEILARVNDSIDISSVQYKGKKFVVTQQMLDSAKFPIFLEPETTILPEINISSSELSGNLETDIETVEKPNALEYAGSREKLTPAERRLYTATSKGEDMVGRKNLRFDIPLAAVLNAVSGKTKKLKAKIKMERALAQVVALENQFAQHFFTDGLGVPVNKIEDFLFYAQAKNDRVYNYKAYNNLEVIEALVSEAQAYKAEGN